ncbi:hypothetical protein [Janthinobacterium sp. PSPC3-1]|uniref:hypothetical protein n=1 Tax=Janthinobacterium sp. PSPC3-1 TaxID=2804653 RepID=UPI003CF04678
MDTASTKAKERRDLTSTSSQRDMFDLRCKKSTTYDDMLLPLLDEEPEVFWDQKSIVELHWLLLKKIEGLSDPQTPLEEKFELLRWIFTDGAHDQMPFSFVNCLEVVSKSPLSPTAYFGTLSSDDVRDWIASNVKGWLQASFGRYPAWIQSEIIHHPDWVAHQLEKNPQWINQKIKTSIVQTDLFS